MTLGIYNGKDFMRLLRIRNMRKKREKILMKKEQIRRKYLKEGSSASGLD